MAYKFIEILPRQPRVNWMKAAPVFFTISSLFILVSVGLLVTKGLNYSVDFLGGTEVHVRFHKDQSASALREALEPIGFQEAMVQEVGDRGREFLVRVPTFDLQLQSSKEELEKALASVPGAGEARIRYSEDRLYVVYGAPTDPNQIRSALGGLTRKDLSIESVSPFGRASDHEYLVQFAGVANRIVQAFGGKFGRTSFEVLQTDQVGPKVGKELRWQALGAVLISIIFILIYVWFRFELEFAPGAILALVHDAVAILGVFALFQLQFDLTTVAAVLTIVGFSINDTIVIYDRIRENIKKSQEVHFVQIINDSINQTMSRTLLTSFTVLLATMSLLLMGGAITYNFALAFTIGILSGSYSTIVIAAPVTVYLRKYVLKRPAA